MRQNASERFHISNDSPNFKFAVFSLFPGLASHGNTNHGPAMWPQDLSKGQPTEGILNHWSYCLLASEI